MHEKSTAARTKALEEECRWLVDRAEDRLSSIRKLTQETNEIPCRLTVETRGGFVKEQE
jgi:hypothetical protein